MPSWLQTLSAIERRLSEMTPEVRKQSFILLAAQFGLTLVPTGEAKS